MDILINIIIPCYYSSDVIRPCFQSLAEQTCKEKIKIFMVNDCSPNTQDEYMDIREEFSNILNIKYIKTPKNSGPGAARQLGLESIDTTAEWVMFLDDDDYLYDQYVIENYISLLQTNKYGFIAGKKINITENNEIENLENDYCGFCGSIFYLPIIEIFQLTFQNIYYDEDSIFFSLYMFYFKIFNNYNLIKKTILGTDYFISYVHRLNNKESLTHQSEFIENRSLNMLKMCSIMIDFFSNIKYTYRIQELLYDEIITLYMCTSYYTQAIILNQSNWQNFLNLIQTINTKLICLIKTNEFIFKNGDGMIYYNYYNKIDQLNNKPEYYFSLDSYIEWLGKNNIFII